MSTPKNDTADTAATTAMREPPDLEQRLDELSDYCAKLAGKTDRMAVLLRVLVRHANGTPRAPSARDNKVINGVLYPEGEQSRRDLVELEEMIAAEMVGI